MAKKVAKQLDEAATENADANRKVRYECHSNNPNARPKERKIAMAMEKVRKMKTQMRANSFALSGA